MKLKVLVVLISAVVFSNASFAVPVKYKYKSEIDLAALEVAVKNTEAIFADEKIKFVSKQGEEPATYINAELAYAAAHTAYEQGKELFNSFLNILSRVHFAKAQGRNRIVEGLKSVLESRYLTVATADEHIELDF
ncbi:MAG: hypothetical protein LBD19_01980 [Endomicrobium sp.]|jgi:hypothetical protein|nr:hypothetical protein [Endomicrobium sp.]